jgi:hypothetical protein
MQSKHQNKIDWSTWVPIVISVLALLLSYRADSRTQDQMSRKDIAQVARTEVQLEEQESKAFGISTRLLKNTNQLAAVVVEAVLTKDRKKKASLMKKRDTLLKQGDRLKEQYVPICFKIKELQASEAEATGKVEPPPDYCG